MGVTIMVACAPPPAVTLPGLIAFDTVIVYSPAGALPLALEVETVSDTVAFGVAVLGLTRQAGTGVWLPVTTQLKETELLNPPTLVRFSVAVAEPPGSTAAGCSP